MEPQQSSPSVVPSHDSGILKSIWSRITEYLIFIGWACLTALSIVITIMTPKFVAYSNLYVQAITNPSIMTEPGSNVIIDGVSTGLKLMFR